MDALAQEFEQSRSHLRSVAFRILGSASEAEDAVQEAWLRLSRSDAAAVENLGGWLTTVVARISLDMLRARTARREEPLEPGRDEVAAPGFGVDSDREAQMADAVGLALLVVLDTLAPAERVAFVLHDTFGVPFEEIARIVGRSPAAARQLASRARRRVRGASTTSAAAVAEHRALVSAFVAALRAGDLNALIAVLHPDLVVRADATVTRGAPSELRGGEAWARQAVLGAAAARAHAASTRLALVDGDVGIVMAPRGRLFRVLRLGFAGGRIASLDVIGDPAELERLELAVLDE